MSYILDALRRAESERERGSLPTVHTTPVPAGLADDEGAAAHSRRWVGALAVLLLLLLGVVAGQWLASPRDQPASVPAPLPRPAPTLQGQVLPATPAAPELRRLQAAPPPEAEPRPTVPPPAAPVRVAAPVPMRALPDALRRQLPALTTSGAMYSETPAKRMLIVNGQLLREGEQVAPDLVLEQIQLKSAVLNFKGQRFSISY
jgi:general secretion pathway protein B